MSKAVAKKRTIKVLRKFMTLSNLLTLSRILVTPIIMYALYKSYFVSAFLLFAYGALSDLLDGYFARLWSEPTVLGTHLDPIADKILLLGSVTMLVHVKFPSLEIPNWFYWFVLIREGVILLGSALIIFLLPDTIITPTKSGKITMFGYLSLIGWIFLCYFCSWMPVKSFTVAMVGIICFSSLSLYQYIRRGLRWLNGARKRLKN